jgi:sugar lactone lactonase YvrE
MSIRSAFRFVAAALCALFVASAALPVSAQDPDTIKLSDPSIFPESVAYNPVSQSLIVGSVRNGTIYAVAADGALTPFIEDPDLKSSFGIYVDEATKRLYVVTSGLGALLAQLPAGGLPSGAPGPNVTPQPGQLPPGLGSIDFSIGLMVYDLETKTRLLKVDLTAASEQQGPKIANGVTTDKDGNAYVTDSIVGVIYRVTPTGEVAFLTDPQFQTQGGGGLLGGGGPGAFSLGLNGIVHHPDGFLIVGKSGDGNLFKIPLDNPQNVTEIALPAPIVGVDGLTLTADGKLIAVSGQSAVVMLLSSADGWATATIEKQIEVADGPTSAAMKGSEVWVLQSGVALRGPGGAGGAGTTPADPALRRLTFG